MKEPDLVVRTRMLNFVNGNKDWLDTTTIALSRIVEQDDQPKERYRAAAEAADDLLAMKPESTPSSASKDKIMCMIGAAYYHVGRYAESIRSGPSSNRTQHRT